MKTTATKCPHEDSVHYGALVQVDGEPQYKVKCNTCKASGVILLQEAGEIWNEPNK